jgi:hypothetical protein
MDRFSEKNGHTANSFIKIHFFSYFCNPFGKKYIFFCDFLEAEYEIPPSSISREELFG